MLNDRRKDCCCDSGHENSWVICFFFLLSPLVSLRTSRVRFDSFVDFFSCNSKNRDRFLFSSNWSKCRIKYVRQWWTLASSMATATFDPSVEALISWLRLTHIKRHFFVDFFLSSFMFAYAFQCVAIIFRDCALANGRAFRRFHYDNFSSLPLTYTLCSLHISRRLFCWPNRTKLKTKQSNRTNENEKLFLLFLKKKNIKPFHRIGIRFFSPVRFCIGFKYLTNVPTNNIKRMFLVLVLMTKKKISTQMPTYILCFVAFFVFLSSVFVIVASLLKFA